MRKLKLILLLICLSYSVAVYGAVTTNLTTSPSGVTNIVKSIFTNGVAGDGKIYLGSTNSGVPIIVILQSKITNGLAGEFIFNANSTTNQFNTAAIYSYVRNALNRQTALEFNLASGIFTIPLMELTTNLSVRISKQAIGVYADSSDANFTLPTDTPLLSGRPNHVVFTNLSATRYVFFPNATNEVGVIYHIKNNSAANSPVITNLFGQKFDGAASYTLTNQYDGVTFYSDGVNWLLESRIP